jgi:acetylornithine deacetylase
VKPADGWTRDPYAPSLEDGRLYGLGVSDDGGSLVALTHAFLAARPQHHTLVLSLSAQEENSEADGFSAALPAMEEKVGPFVCGIVGEPTGLRMAVSEKGLMVLDCTVKGVAGHAARGNGVNAIYEALPVIEWFRESGMQVTQISAGTQHNVIPDVCRFVVDVRTTGPNEDVLARILGSVDCEVKARSTRLNGSSIGPDHPLVKAAETLGLETYASPTLSNQALCPFPTVKLGPGDPSLSHKADEYILIDEVEKGVQTYLKLLEAYENLG